uniref:4-coumarate--CoA ligase n=1 Tax=Panagrolaimus davidi TaxID=227884 RepID=A0A914QMF9_9BILA
MPFNSIFPSIPIETQPFGERLLNSFWQNSIKNKKAIICAENPKYFITYKNLYIHTLSVVGFLESKKFGHGDIAALVLSNSWEFLEIVTAVALRGGGVSAASVLFTDYELERQFIDCKAKIVFVCDNNLERVLKASKNCKTLTTIIVIQVSDRTLPEQSKNLSFGVIPFSTVLSFPPSFTAVDINVERDIFLLPYSSGTTGSPKGVMLSHQNYSTLMSIFINHLEKYVYPKIAPNWNHEKEVALLSMPFYHIYGFSILIKSILCGQTCVILTNFNKEIYLQSIQNYKIRELYVVPTLLMFFANDPIIDSFNLSSLEFMNIAAAPTSKTICKKVFQRLQTLKRIDISFGLSECSLACALPNPISDKARIDIAGTLISNYEMKVIDKNGNELKCGEIGELCLRSPTIMLGYLGKPEATAEVIDDEGWLHTGDLIKYDSHGNIYSIDRLKEIIKVKGYQVAPAELEDILLSHSGIADAAVIGIKHEIFGEVPKAFIVKSNESLTEQQIQEYMNGKTASYKHLKGGIEFVTYIPKSPAGKILRRFLQENNKSKL